MHVGIPIGPAQQPAETWTTEFNNTVYVAVPQTFMADLEAARRLNIQLFISFTGSPQNLVDAGGFSMTIWKQRVDRFRQFDVSSYIADGTILGHFILDEPNDESNWGGKVVPPALIEEMAKYSKQIWPTMPTMVRTWPDFLAGLKYPDLDAIRVQYHVRFGDIDAFIKKNAQEAKDLGLTLVGGLNVTKGGGTQSGLPPYERGRYPMNATQVRTFGKRYLSEPGICGFVLWDYRSDYFSRTEIKDAMADLTRQARALPSQPCKHR